MESMNNYRLSFAPLQGHTGHIYRNLFAKIFGNIDRYYTPYLSFENDGSIKNAKLRDVSDINKDICVIPQILFANADEAIKLAKIVEEKGYDTVNLNLGCPFPMTINKGRGSALLSHPEKLDEIFNLLFSNTKLKISIKTRTGLHQHSELEAIIPIFNKYPFCEIIIHPRVADQLYKGEADVDEFLKYRTLIKHVTVYNGDINSSNFQHFLSGSLKDQHELMIGRGILQNPFLPMLIRNIPIVDEKSKIREFITALIESYQKAFTHDPFVLNKMKEHFEYLGDWFPAELKIKKKVKKAKNLSEFKEAFRY